MRRFYLVLLTFLNLCVLSAQELIVYPAPRGVDLNGDFSVKVRVPGQNWQDLDEYLIKVDAFKVTGHSPENSSMAYFDFSGIVEVSVTNNRGDIQSTRIRPLAYGIKPEVKGNTLTFSLSQPRNLSVEVNGDIFHNLQLFANPIEKNRPDPKDPNIIYYGPGIHEVPGSMVPVLPNYYGSSFKEVPGKGIREVPGSLLTVPSGKTVYLAGGAVFRGLILISGVENVHVLGRGMIDQSMGHGVTIANSKNVEVNGIIGPKFLTGGSSNVTIRNVKCISYATMGDGMNILCSSDVLIDGVFNRNSDDCITVYGSYWGFTGDARRITVQNSSLWADVAHPILIGTEGNTPKPETLEDIRFFNLDILDQKEPQLDYQGCMSINAGDSNLIRNVRFENIRVEDFRQGQLVNLRVFYNLKWCTSPGRGIENIYFKNIIYNGSHANMSVIAGYDDAHKVKNVIFENLVINGTVISDKMVKATWYKTSDMANIFVGEHVEGIEFRESSSQVVK